MRAHHETAAGRGHRRADERAARRVQRNADLKYPPEQPHDGKRVPERHNKRQEPHGDALLVQRPCQPGAQRWQEP